MPKSTLKRSLVCVIFPMIIACYELKAEEEHFRTNSIKLTSKLAKESIPSETAMVMAGVGIDFPVLLQHCLSGDIRAVRLLFWTSSNVGLDGAASEGFGYYLIAVGEKIGDEKLLQAVTNLNRETLESIKFYMLDEYGYSIPKEGSKVKAELNISKLFPTTWKHIKKMENKAQ